MDRQQNDFTRRVLTVAGIAILGFLAMALVWRTAEALRWWIVCGRSRRRRA